MPDADFLTAKADAELLFPAHNPGYYHPDLIRTARRELHRRGGSLVVPAVVPPTVGPVFADTVPARPWSGL
ncbi:hypothetical protein GCM10022408_24030 [Hymenobacter fastidiosus]|uniref:MBL fold metallo-hydrolase n=1 Tax=Hymenobacter fastidiosus TaxID=486264 RepID=A0ABP7SFC8_9BACT